MSENAKRPKTYAQSGVDFSKEEQAVKGIKKWVTKTFDFRKGRIGEVMGCIGSFANMIDMGEYAIAFATDGVGSKVLVAQDLEKYDTIGIDCIAMNVNDVICVGAEPISMVDYIAFERTDNRVAHEISKGLYEGAKLAEISIVGGETASLPDIICGIKGRGFDIAAAVIGVVKKDEIITGEKIEVGDIVLGMKSSGIHSNGLTLARKVLPRDMHFNILTPTRIYVKEIMHLKKKFEIKGMANITGGGFLNLLRTTKHGFLLDSLPQPQMIFKKIQELGGISDGEMYQTFNMGVGFCLIVSPEVAEDMLSQKAGEYELMKIGKVIERQGVTILKGKQEIQLERTVY
jgi:phosphoribosylformylglycinamidine cyclo-ligase